MARNSGTEQPALPATITVNRFSKLNQYNLTPL